jgi:hypothetical protein
VRIATHLDGCLVAMHTVSHQTWWSVLFIPLSFLKLYFFLLYFLPYPFIFPSYLYFLSCTAAMTDVNFSFKS